LFAEAPVSTGMPGHATPMGRIQRNPEGPLSPFEHLQRRAEPYMQRITWAAVAMHEGVAAGPPGLHGCIRMRGPRG